MTTPSEKHILVLEDEKPMARALEIKLSRAGFKVTAVGNGLMGLEALGREQFHLIMCDLIMPKMDGFHVLEELRARGNTIPIIIMTNLSQEEDKARALSLGARDFIVKSNTPISDIVQKATQMLADTQ